jgi:HPt (histidine-containing phosphotransfer) domain-containing protein
MSESVAPATLDRTALEALSEMTGGDPAFLAEMIDTFVDDGQTLVAEMESAAASGDLVALRRASHTLKSNSRTFGATVLGDICQEIESHAAAGRGDEAGGLIGRAAAEYPAVVAALMAERSGV